MRAAFTLVEMLVVITIIGILAALGTGAVMNAVHRAKIAAVGLEISQLDQACKDYKTKFGEYPPDFTDLTPNGAVARHLAKAFPRYPGSYTGNWQTDIQNVTGIPVANWTPQMALAFWLGGIPDPNNGGHLSGFAADPTNPFQLPATCPSRTTPLFEFDVNRLSKTAAGAITYRYWPKPATGNMTTGAIVYFRAENGNYLMPNGAVKSVNDAGGTGIVYPAVDTRVGNTWLNQSSFQIFSSGLDLKYGAVQISASQPALMYPTGDNYQPETFDDITNFSNGTLEDGKP